jgi:hypothetical protein
MKEVSGKGVSGERISGEKDTGKETGGERRYAWVVVALLWGVALLNYMDRQMLSTMKNAMRLISWSLKAETSAGLCRNSSGFTTDDPSQAI